MEPDEVLKQLRRIHDESKVSPNNTMPGILAEAAELTRTVAGEKSAFYKGLEKLIGHHSGYSDEMREAISGAMTGITKFVEAGLFGSLTLERKAQIDVVSDFLSQAQQLLEDSRIHPGAPAFLIGASLEEYLRNWAEDKNLSIGARNPSIDAFASVLRENDEISKQEKKDIDSWAGIRNDAAHGRWEEVSESRRIKLMLEGVNLFMQRHSGPST